MQYFNIQVASQLSGVASATIRAWEKRYNAVIPERGDNKHRLYSESDIEKLSILFKLTELGQSIGKIAHLPISELKNIYGKLMHRPYEELRGGGVSAPVDYQKLLSGFYLALAVYKLDIISHELEKAKAQLSPRDLCLNILVPLFHEIGNKVYRNELTIAQEHTLSAIVSFHMGQMIGQHYRGQHRKDDLILITTPEGEMHEIGILAAALLCVQHNLKFIFLGTNLPVHSLAEAANALKANTILIGATKGNELDEQKTVSEYVSELNGLLKVKTKIWVGGGLKASVRAELEKRNVTVFPTLQALDEELEKF